MAGTNTGAVMGTGMDEDGEGEGEKNNRPFAAGVRVGTKEI